MLGSNPYDVGQYRGGRTRVEVMGRALLDIGPAWSIEFCDFPNAVTLKAFFADVGFEYLWRLSANLEVRDSVRFDEPGNYWKPPNDPTRVDNFMSQAPWLHEDAGRYLVFLQLYQDHAGHLPGEGNLTVAATTTWMYSKRYLAPLLDLTNSRRDRPATFATNVNSHRLLYRRLRERAKRHGVNSEYVEDPRYHLSSAWCYRSNAEYYHVLAEEDFLKHVWQDFSE